MIAFAETANVKAGPEAFETAVELIDLLLARLARTGTLAAPRPRPPRAKPRSSPASRPTHTPARAWADLAQSLGARARQGKAVNLDPAGLILDMLLKLDACAASLARRA